jgi:hypothetical protein
MFSFPPNGSYGAIQLDAGEHGPDVSVNHKLSAYFRLPMRNSKYISRTQDPLGHRS